jgi:putative transposase
LVEKKVLDYPAEVRQVMIDRGDPAYSVRQQCGLLRVNRSNLYYQAIGESELNLQLMRLLDEQYTRTPCYGVLRMEAYLRSLGYEVNAKRVRRLLRTMGLDAVYQKPATSTPNPEHDTNLQSI